MAAPNIAALTTIIGKTAVANVGTTSANIVINSAASNKVFKINSLIISNIDGTNSADATVDLFRSTVAYNLAFTVPVPADSTLVVVSKDNTIYLEEGDSIRVAANTAGDLQAICSYEEIS